ncbi:MAG TPA: hypothetical protein PKC21_02925 [Oligoflexia bacterium]|nr:hypothetical protein [Oligoflexia bacterium]HMR24286.1 hypothetical protein [Oligoflexia bacterium]
MQFIQSLVLVLIFLCSCTVYAQKTLKLESPHGHVPNVTFKAESYRQEHLFYHQINGSFPILGMTYNDIPIRITGATEYATPYVLANLALDNWLKFTNLDDENTPFQLTWINQEAIKIAVNKANIEKVEQIWKSGDDDILLNNMLDDFSMSDVLENLKKERFLFVGESSSEFMPFVLRTFEPEENNILSIDLSYFKDTVEYDDNEEIFIAQAQNQLFKWHEKQFEPYLVQGDATQLLLIDDVRLKEKNYDFIASHFLFGHLVDYYDSYLPAINFVTQATTLLKTGGQLRFNMAASLFALKNFRLQLFTELQKQGDFEVLLIKRDVNTFIKTEFARLFMSQFEQCIEFSEPLYLAHFSCMEDKLAALLPHIHSSDWGMSKVKINQQLYRYVLKSINAASLKPEPPRTSFDHEGMQYIVIILKR